MNFLLAVYVDDLKMAGPKQNLAKGWDMIRTRLRLEPETPLSLYLECQLCKKLHDGTEVNTVTHDMETCLDMTVKKYLDVTGLKEGNLHPVPIESSCRSKVIQHVRQLLLVPSRAGGHGVRTNFRLTRMVGFCHLRPYPRILGNARSPRKTAAL